MYPDGAGCKGHEVVLSLSGLLSNCKCSFRPARHPPDSRQDAGTMSCTASENPFVTYGEWRGHVPIWAVENRPQTRYDFRCEATFAKSAGASLPGVISDISLSGCYLETITPEPVGTALQVEFEFNGSRVQLPGVVRVVHPAMGMGIQFSSVPQDFSERLQKLVQAQAAGA